MTASQRQLPLRVTICAWCRPKELGSTLGEVSHGICPRHLRKIGASMSSPPRRPRGSHRERQSHTQILLPLD